MNASQANHFDHPRTIVMRFIARRTVAGAILWGTVFGLTIVSSALGYIAAFPTAADRAKAVLFSNNAGFEALLGPAHNIDTVTGFTAWRALGLIVLLGAVWAILTSTNVFRGNEENGRWELLISGQTTARRAALQALTGLGLSIVALTVIVAVITIVTGQVKDIGYGIGGALFFTLALISSTVMFTALGACMSQLAFTRRRAAAWTAAVFGLAFLARAASNANSDLSWLGNLSPLHWIDQLRPLTDPHPQWFLPIITLTLLLIGLTVWLAGQRDLGSSIIADRDTARARTMLLGNSFLAHLRLQTEGFLGWLVGLTLFAVVVSSVASAAAKAFNEASGAIQHILQQLGSEINGTTSFIGFLYVIITTLLMLMVASRLSALREEEALGFLDNLLVRHVSRTRWLLEQITLAVMALITVSLLIALVIWVSLQAQQSAIPFHKLLLASINSLVPAVLLLSFGALTFGTVPRITAFAGYGLVAWSFLVELLGPAINANHWLLDTSLLHHTAAVPAADIRWSSLIIMTCIALGAGIIGAWGFARRDVTVE